MDEVSELGMNLKRSEDENKKLALIIVEIEELRLLYSYMAQTNIDVFYWKKSVGEELIYAPNKYKEIIEDNAKKHDEKYKGELKKIKSGF